MTHAAVVNYGPEKFNVELRELPRPTSAKTTSCSKSPPSVSAAAICINGPPNIAGR